MIEDIELLAHDASAMVNATADVAGEQVEEARQQLTAGVKRVRALYAEARSRTIDGTHAADVMLHNNLYPVLAVGIGVGALVGWLLATRCPCRRN